jgi:hypothetical protein
VPANAGARRAHLVQLRLVLRLVGRATSDLKRHPVAQAACGCVDLRTKASFEPQGSLFETSPDRAAAVPKRQRCSGFADRSEASGQDLGSTAVSGGVDFEPLNARKAAVVLVQEALCPDRQLPLVSDGTGRIVERVSCRCVHACSERWGSARWSSKWRCREGSSYRESTRDRRSSSTLPRTPTWDCELSQRRGPSRRRGEDRRRASHIFTPDLMGSCRQGYSTRPSIYRPGHGRVTRRRPH